MVFHIRAAEDILVHKDEDHPTWMFGMNVTEDAKYLVLYTSRDTARVRFSVLCSHDSDDLMSHLSEKPDLGN